MVEKIVPFLLDIDQVVPVRSKQTFLNEMAMALIEAIRIYGKKIKKFGKIHKIAMSFWPVRLVPLTETRACVCSYLLNTQEKIDAGNFSQVPPKPDTVIKGADPQTFLDSLSSYTSNYLKKKKNFKRNTVVQEALFSASEIDYFKNFFLNQYQLSSFGENYFLLEGDPIAKSVNQIEIVKEIKDFVLLKDIQMLDQYADIITKLCDQWIQKTNQMVNQKKNVSADTKNEEQQLSRLNNQLQAEKEKDLKNSPEELLKRGKFKIIDKTPQIANLINSVKAATDKLRSAVSQKNLFLMDEAFKEVHAKQRKLNDEINAFDLDITNLKKELTREETTIEKNHQKKISDLESQIATIKSQINSKVSQHSETVAEREDLIVQIREEKQSALDLIEDVKDFDLTNVQNFIGDYTMEIKTDNVVVGLPIFIFYFADPSTGKTTERAPVLPLLIEKGKPVSTKVKDGFRDKLSNLMNKLTPVINLVETEGDKNNLMEMKNLDSHLEEAINDLRIRKILKKKLAEQAKEIVYELMW